MTKTKYQPSTDSLRVTKLLKSMNILHIPNGYMQTIDICRLSVR